MPFTQTPKFLPRITLQLRFRSKDQLCCRSCPFFVFFSLTFRDTSATLQQVAHGPVVEPDGTYFCFFVFLLFFCSQLRRARIKAPQCTTTSIPLMSFIARRRHRFNPLPHRDPTSNRKKNRTGLQPRKRAAPRSIICGHKVPKSSRPQSRLQKLSPSFRTTWQRGGVPLQAAHSFVSKRISASVMKSVHCPCRMHSPVIGSSIRLISWWSKSSINQPVHFLACRRGSIQLKMSKNLIRNKKKKKMIVRRGESERGGEVCAPSGHASVHAFQQSVIRFSRAVMGEDDSGLALAAFALQAQEPRTRSLVREKLNSDVRSGRVAAR